MNRRIRAAVTALLTVVSSTFLALAPASASVTVSDSIVVNEFAAGKFIELRNVSDSTVDIGGFKLWLCGPNGLIGDPRIALGAVLEPGDFWVFASSSYTGGTVHQSYNGVFPTGGAALLDLALTWVDGVATVAGSRCGEGSRAPQCPGWATARDSASTDTDSNAVDFRCRVPSPAEVN